jgi:erythromycin esterase-like protein
LIGTPGEYDALLDRVGDARSVLIGEASQGPTSSTASAAAITKRLIEETGFVAVALEADWPTPIV